MVMRLLAYVFPQSSARLALFAKLGLMGLLPNIAKHAQPKRGLL